jgi:putative ABC transport system permease protein
MGFERWVRVVRLFGRSLFFRRRVDEELDEELGYHIDRLTEQYVARGADPSEARRVALAAMDGLQQRREECRDMRHMRVFEELHQDVRNALRQFRRNPGFAAAIIGVLALAIAGNTAIFSVGHAVLSPLAIPHAERAVMVWTENPARNWHQFPASMPDVREWQASGVFASLGAFHEDGFNLRMGDRTDRVEGLTTTNGFFETLSMAPARGRLYGTGPAGAEDVAADHVAVIGDRLWRRIFASRPDIVGQSVVLNGSIYTIAGVLPPNFPRFGRADLFAPMPADVQAGTDRGSRSFNVIGRLRDGLSLAAAGQRMREVSADLAKRYPHEDGGMTTSLQPVQEAFVEDAKLLLALLMGAVATALAVACANVASMLLARSLSRRKELAIRAALGCGRWRLTRQLVTEHVLLGAAAGIIAIVPAWWGVRAIASIRLDELPNAELAGLDTMVLAFNFGIALLTGVLCGVIPASLAWKRDLNDPLKGSSSSSAVAGPAHQRLRGLFVGFQIAFTVVLLVGGGLMLRSFLRLLSESPGYNQDHALTMRIALSETQYASPEQQVAFFDRVVERANALPGVRVASAIQELPTSDSLHGSALLFPGQPEPRPEDIPIALRSGILPDYFRAMQIPLVRGRYFNRADTKDSRRVAVIDEWTAARYWPHQNPVGQQFKMGRTQPWLEVAGVVGNVEAPIVVRFLKGRIGQVYLPLTQEPGPRMSLVVRASGDAAALSTPIRAIVREVDADQPVFDVRTLDEVRASDRRIVWLVTTLLTGFAIMALLLAAVGLYGTIAYDVGQRTREFGLRLSLGAQPSAVMFAVLKRGARLLLAGAVLGLAGAVLSTRLIASVLSDVRASDPLPFTGAVLLLAAGGFLATYLPARRATRIDPIVALRSE